MHRRLFIGAGISSIAVAKHGQVFAQEATPEQPATAIDQKMDLRAREIVAMMQDIHPVTMLEALETATVSGDNPTSLVPITWQDFGDTDLYNSLGGVFIAQEGADLNSSDTELYGGYIVYESAEIAYHELQRKLNDMDANWNGTSDEGGTTTWHVDSDDLHIRISRIGYVVLINLATSGFSSTDHLYVVAQSTQ